MYQRIERIETITLTNESTAFPVASLRNEHGAHAHWIIDDGCYVLVIENSRVDDFPGFKMTPWIFPEALAVLRTLPPLRGE